MCGYRALFRTCTKIGKVFEKEVYGSVHLVYDIVQFCGDDFSIKYCIVIA